MKYKTSCLFFVYLIFFPMLAWGALEEENASSKRIKEVLTFWFGPSENLSSFPEDRLALWKSGSSDFDRQIKNRFEPDVKRAILGELNSWRETPDGRLALILLLDQFPRRLYRNKPQAYASDAMVKGLVLEGLQRGDDKKLFPVERIFFYMPLQHSEDANLQNLSVKLYTQLVEESQEVIRAKVESYLQSAILHQQTIARFKRFPNRNKVLGRDSTPEEIIYVNHREIDF